MRVAGARLGVATAALPAGGAATVAFSDRDANGTRAPVSDAVTVAPVIAATGAAAATLAVASGAAARPWAVAGPAMEPCVQCSLPQCVKGKSHTMEERGGKERRGGERQRSAIKKEKINHIMAHPRQDVPPDPAKKTPEGLTFGERAYFFMQLVHASGRRPVFHCLAWKGHLSRVSKPSSTTRLASSQRGASAYGMAAHHDAHSLPRTYTW